ncbi:MAG: sel1 repeat family protein [Gammaproteobacteria bacterium]|nr:sel1 repeat family protein [Gammaproteobacteria bacterium]
MTAIWHYFGDKNPGAQPKNSLKLDVVADDDAGYVVFEMTRQKDELFPAGDYEVCLYLNGIEMNTLDFAVVTPTTADLLQQAQAGIVDAKFGLYAYLVTGKLEGMSEGEAVQWLRKAAESGNALAQYNLGAVYLEGKHGIDKNEDLAIKWFKRSANAGNPHAKEIMERINQVLNKKN